MRATQPHASVLLPARRQNGTRQAQPYRREKEMVKAGDAARAAMQAGTEPARTTGKSRPEGYSTRAAKLRVSETAAQAAQCQAAAANAQRQQAMHGTENAARAPAAAVMLHTGTRKASTVQKNAALRQAGIVEGSTPSRAKDRPPQSRMSSHV